MIDDLHAADPGTVLLARFVARNLRADPLLLVTSRRPGETAPETAAVLEAFEQDARLIVLRHLDIHDTDAFLRAHGAAPVDPDFVLATLRLTGGNPLFLRRVVAAGDTGRGRQSHRGDTGGGGAARRRRPAGSSASPRCSVARPQSPK